MSTDPEVLIDAIKKGGHQHEKTLLQVASKPEHQQFLALNAKDRKVREEATRKCVENKKVSAQHLRELGQRGEEFQKRIVVSVLLTRLTGYTDGNHQRNADEILSALCVIAKQKECSDAIATEIFKKMLSLTSESCLRFSIISGVFMNAVIDNPHDAVGKLCFETLVKEKKMNFNFAKRVKERAFSKAAKKAAESWLKV